MAFRGGGEEALAGDVTFAGGGVAAGAAGCRGGVLTVECAGGGGEDVLTGAITFPEAGVAAGAAACCGRNVVASWRGDETPFPGDVSLPEVGVTGAACAFLGGDVQGLVGDDTPACVGVTGAVSGSRDSSSTVSLGGCATVIGVMSGHTWKKKRIEGFGCAL